MWTTWFLRPLALHYHNENENELKKGEIARDFENRITMPIQKFGWVVILE